VRRSRGIRFREHEMRGEQAVPIERPKLLDTQRKPRHSGTAFGSRGASGKARSPRSKLSPTMA
jgi:hypothetical protein